MTYYDIEDNCIKNVLLTHSQSGWSAKGVRDYFPSVSALTRHVLIGHKFAEKGVQFAPINRGDAEVRVSAGAPGTYVVRPSAAGALCLTILQVSLISFGNLENS